MFFTDLVFFIFLPTVVLLYWAFPLLFGPQKGHRLQNLLLFFASYLFYGWAVPWTVLLMLGMTVLHFYSALWIQKLNDSNDHLSAKKALILCTVISISILSWFKYTNFVLANLKLIFPNLPIHLSILLPAGVSFFTFHALAYTIDVYRKDFKAKNNFIDFAVFMAFFPQLVAGPISRASNLLTQVIDHRKWNKSDFIQGIDLLFIGFVKKIVIADNVATYVNMIFDLKNPSMLMLFVGGIGFSIQILADFSSYTDIARGCSRLMGFDLIENFNRPYLAQNPGDFWRRWHMSLSNCIRDYIYIPLGGSRVSEGRWVINILFTWFLCGMWHGAGWNFIAWGLYWGILLILYKYVTLIPETRFSWIIRLPVMFFWIVIGWILFRTNDLALFQGYVNQPYLWNKATYGFVILATLLVFIFYALPLFILLATKIVDERTNFFKRYFLPSRIVGYGFAILLLILFAAERSEDFYYFQF